MCLHTSTLCTLSQRGGNSAGVSCQPHSSTKITSSFCGVEDWGRKKGKEEEANEQIDSSAGTKVVPYFSQRPSSGGQRHICSIKVLYHFFQSDDDGINLHACTYMHREFLQALYHNTH